MTRNRSILALVAIVAIVAGGYLAYDNVLRGDAVAPLALPSTAPSAAASTAPSAATATEAASAAPSSDAVDGAVAGTWTITAGSEAGYRVREQLANLPAESDAVGRTDRPDRHDHGRRSGRRRAADRGRDLDRHDDARPRTRTAATTGCGPRDSRPTSTRPPRSR